MVITAYHLQIMTLVKSLPTGVDCWVDYQFSN